MKQLIVGDKIELDIINIPGYDLGDVAVTNNGVDVKDLFNVFLDVGEPSTVVLRGYARGKDGKFIKVFGLDEDGKPELTGIEEVERKFVVSGKIELVIEKEIDANVKDME